LAGEGGRLTLPEVAASVGDSSALQLEDLVHDALDGRVPEVEAGLDRLFLEGRSPVTILGAARRHAQRLHLAGVQVAAGTSLDAVLRGLKPPLFFKHVDRFRAQLGAWPPERCQRFLRLLTQAELDCKRTGFPDETICRQALTIAGRLPGRRQGR
jgi:DNA polymerase-3 subunit delta